MSAVHFYLAAWVLGGMLLGASLLLDGREQPDPSSLPDGGESRGPGTAAHSRWLVVRLSAFGLIGFGLCGLAASGLGFDPWPWTLVCAGLVGSSLVGLGRVLSRSVS